MIDKEKLIRINKDQHYCLHSQDDNYLEEQYKTRNINIFYSLCRNVNDFSNVAMDDVDFIVDLLREKYENNSNCDFIVKTLSDRINDKTLTPTEAMYAYINIVDPNLEVLESHKVNNKSSDIKKEIDDKRLVLLELYYLRTRLEENKDEKAKKI